MRPLFRTGVAAAALAVSYAGLQLEPATLTKLSFENAVGRVEIGAVRVSLWNAAFAQDAGTIILDNVTTTIGPATYRMGRIEFSGVTSSKADIEALFKTTTQQDLLDRISKLNAKQISVPELVVDQKIADRSTHSTYRNIVASDIGNGRIASTTMETMAEEVDGLQGKQTTTMGRGVVQETDLAALVRLYAENAPTASEPLKPIYKSFSIDNIAMTEGDNTTVKIDRMQGQDFVARAIPGTWSGASEKLLALSDKQAASADHKLSKEESREAVSIFANLMEAFDIGSVEVIGVQVQGAAEEGKTKGADIRISRAFYTGTAGGKPSAVGFEGFNAVEPDSKVKIDSVSLTGFSLKPTLEGLRSMQDRSVDDLKPEEWRTFAPTLGTLQIHGLDVDTVEKEGDRAGEPVKVTLQDFTLTADQPVNGIPSNLRLGLKELALALPDSSNDESIQQLIDMGYENLKISLALDTSWNEAASQLDIKAISFQGQDIGSVNLTGTLTGVSKDVFNPDTALATVALMGSRAQSLNLTLVNGGLFDRYLSMAAAEQKTKPENLRRTYGTAATFLIPSMIGNSAQAKSITQAVSRFIAKPGTLTINAKAKSTDGIGITDIMGQSEPGQVLEQLDVTAKAE